ncbi:MmcQ/YjbR family DNA-binding protein [Leucobacter coleopterorum]|uniref:MmcQ/YjbR family DNA-binding protein n=1 Tax=Leucobacter coleopterorum TaxID=2714933 RepID=A0ABX6JXB7_9MICO|nr:MmcQ/YjbR family DNA-binding protein [Leucobacter coleopterorum]QIM18972.1 MmcQ/YjbR family DNA-binding protein [Leucobacter coleopterorum]
MTEAEPDLSSHAGVDACLKRYAGSESSYPFGPGARVYKVANKMFALLGEPERESEQLRLTLKGPVLRNELLVRDFAAIHPGYHMNKQHWITITLDGSVEVSLLEELIAESYELVFMSLPRAVREKIGA